MKPQGILRSMLALGVACLPVSGFAQINTGSDGHDGAFNPTTNTVINMADHLDGIYQYTSVNIPQGIIVTFIPNPNNTPIVWLVQSNCVINGTLDISGRNAIGSLGGLGGPGGYAGGSSGGNHITAGGGPGGGPSGSQANGLGGSASYGSAGVTNAGTPPGVVYGNPFLLPLLGGSGGGGGFSQGYGGGGGAGAILIAAPNQIEIDGSLVADGGDAFWSTFGGSGGAGSGGAVRLVATSIVGSGSIYAFGGLSQNWFRTGGMGRVRFDALGQVHFATINGVFTQGFQSIIIPAAGQGLSLSIASVGGVAVVSPKGLPLSPDVIISGQTTRPVPVLVQCSNIPLNTAITVVAVPTSGQTAQATAMNSGGTLASSTATVPMDLPHGSGIVYAQAVIGVGTSQGAGLDSGRKSTSYAQTGLTTKGERFAKIELKSILGGPQQIVYVTEAGKKYLVK